MFREWNFLGIALETYFSPIQTIASSVKVLEQSVWQRSCPLWEEYSLEGESREFCTRGYLRRRFDLGTLVPALTFFFFFFLLFLIEIIDIRIQSPAIFRFIYLFYFFFFLREKFASGDWRLYKYSSENYYVISLG